MNNIDVSIIPSFNYFDIEGRLDTEGIINLQSNIDHQMHYGSKHFVFDLSKLNYLNSSALRIFIKTQKQLKLVDGFLLILSPSKSINDLLQMSELIELLRVKNSMHEVMNEIKLS